MTTTNQITHPFAPPSFKKDFGPINSDNPYLVFLVMEREKVTYGQAQTIITTAARNLQTKELSNKYGL